MCTVQYILYTAAIYTAITVCTILHCTCLYIPQAVIDNLKITATYCVYISMYIRTHAEQLATLQASIEWVHAHACTSYMCVHQMQSHTLIINYMYTCVNASCMHVHAIDLIVHQAHCVGSTCTAVMTMG